jgi:hypothetical protein
MVMLVSEYVMSSYPFSNLNIQIHMKEKVVWQWKKTLQWQSQKVHNTA